MTTKKADFPRLDPTEEIKARSHGLRGTLIQGLQDEITGAVREDDTALLKFHGVYQQDNRDARNERMRRKLEPAYQFMARVRMPGGVCTPAQWLALDDIARTYADGTLRATTRQTFQFHGVLKRNLKPAIRAINDSLLSTVATCGDVSRNVMCHPNPFLSKIHREVFLLSERLSEDLLPKSRAYHEIWLDGERITPTPELEAEPLYGKTYLPRKFKIAIAVPPSNDVDVFAHCLGFIAIVNEGQLVGFNVSVGGGMGMTHGDAETFPRLGQVIGACLPDQVLHVAEQTIAIQRDFGNRSNRRRARFKYTIEDRGVDWFRSELEARLGWALGEARSYAFTSRGDDLGWAQGDDGNWHLTIRVPSGRIADRGEASLLTGFREIALIHRGDFRLTPNQNVIVSNITSNAADGIERIATEHGMDAVHARSALRRHAISCVSFPTCGLAMAESERVLADLLARLEPILDRTGLRDEPISLRVTGCPNGCARPYLGEIALVGKGPNKYKMFIGGSPVGERLAGFYKDSVSLDESVELLGPLLHEFAGNRQCGEAFGDWAVRAGHVDASALRGL